MNELMVMADIDNTYVIGYQKSDDNDNSMRWLFLIILIGKDGDNQRVNGCKWKDIDEFRI